MPRIDGSAVAGMVQSRQLGSRRQLLIKDVPWFLAELRTEVVGKWECNHRW